MQTATPEPPSPPARIYDYLDYRALLRDRYQARKRENRSFSYRYIAGKAGMDAGTVVRILKGERNLDPEMAGRLARVFGLNEQERVFFEALVLFGQAKSHAEQNHFLERIFRLRGVKASTLEEGQYEYYRDWYNLGLRELLNFYPFAGDFKALGRMLRPAITPAEAKKAFNLLLRIGLVKKGADGKVRLADKAITSGESIRSLFLKNMQMAMAELALRALDDAEPRERDFSGLTFSLSPRGLEKIKAKLKECRKDMMEIARQDENVDGVYRMNLQLFPISRTYAAGKEEP